MGGWILLSVLALTLLLFGGGWGLLGLVAVIIGGIVLVKGQSDD